jgi:hypothetical protein
MKKIIAIVLTYITFCSCSLFADNLILINDPSGESRRLLQSDYDHPSNVQLDITGHTDGAFSIMGMDFPR